MEVDQWAFSDRNHTAEQVIKAGTDCVIISAITVDDQLIYSWDT